MKKVILPLVVLLVTVAACNKDKTTCYQSDVTFTYDTYSQYDSSYTTAKLCLKESEWENLEFEGIYDPITGTVTQPNEVGTTAARFYQTERKDSVTRTTKTYSVGE